MADSNYWTRFAGTRLSRRTALRGAAVGAAGLAGAALIGCGSSDDKTPTPTTAPGGGGSTATAAPTATTAPEQIKRGGVYRGGFTGPFAGVDPHNSVYGGSGIIRETYSYLFRKEILREDLGLIRELATSHEVTDGTTWIFKLRNDAKIAPNDKGVAERAMDSEDVVKSFDRIANPANGSNGFPFFSTWAASWDAPDAQTVRLTTKEPYAWTEEVLGDALQGAIVPREWLDAGDAIKAAAVGSGAWMLTQLAEGDRAVMKPNPNYYDAGKPYLDEYRIHTFADVATQRTAFATRQLDSYSTASPSEAQELVKTVDGIEMKEIASTGYNSFWMNTASGAPWDDPRVRRAMNLSMNRDQYIAIIGQELGAPMGPLAPVFGDYALSADELAKLQPYDAGEAKKLFDAASVSEVTFMHPTSSTMNDYVNIMVQQLQQIGVTAKPQPLDAGTWVAGYYTSKLPASFSLNQSYKTPGAALLWYRTGGITGNGRYDTGYYTPEVDAALDKAATTIDLEGRKAAYLEAQRLILASDPAFINVFNTRSHSLWYSDIQGINPGPGVLDTALIREYWIDA